ncbi:hypothetical protein PHLGIDRAFT_500213 [Phlebiopsis gigantea 11061_1 CR5-6]|uniref:Uncharacterized protein n=1 Tax=Phlebiopsis gigantea (strain 11061_1 CR5-6) TaxID=745531 RepID=A0A0C3NDV4_PHLG1|nr:hypothetical protein PHLGIDRAFT_500213 [Phlebiopsis gigantea 11061_1 CR5-6]
MSERAAESSTPGQRPIQNISAFHVARTSESCQEKEDVHPVYDTEESAVLCTIDNACRRTFHNGYEFAEHLRDQHSSQLKYRVNRPPNKCSLYVKPRTTGTVVYKCFFHNCLFTSSSAWPTFKIHIDSHLGIAPHECPHIEMATRDPSDSRSLQLVVCSARYSDPSALLHHRKTRHAWSPGHKRVGGDLEPQASQLVIRLQNPGYTDARMQRKEHAVRLDIARCAYAAGRRPAEELARILAVVEKFYMTPPLGPRDLHTGVYPAPAGQGGDCYASFNRSSTHMFEPGALFRPGMFAGPACVATSQLAPMSLEHGEHIPRGYMLEDRTRMLLDDFRVGPRDTSGLSSLHSARPALKDASSGGAPIALLPHSPWTFRPHDERDSISLDRQETDPYHHAQGDFSSIAGHSSTLVSPADSRRVPHLLTSAARASIKSSRYVEAESIRQLDHTSLPYRDREPTFNSPSFRAFSSFDDIQDYGLAPLHLPVATMSATSALREHSSETDVGPKFTPPTSPTSATSQINLCADSSVSHWISAENATPTSTLRHQAFEASLGFTPSWSTTPANYFDVSEHRTDFPMRSVPSSALEDDKEEPLDLAPGSAASIWLRHCGRPGQYLSLERPTSFVRTSSQAERAYWSE